MTIAPPSGRAAIARRGRLAPPAFSVLAALLVSVPAAGQDAATRVKSFRRSAEEAQAQSRQLEAERPRVISGSIVMNTVRQYPKKPDLDGYLENRSAQARAWELKVAAGEAQRTAVLNPYNRSTYTKYYDANGDWQFSVIENDYRATEKLQEDWNREFRRARATLEGLRREYDSLVADTGLTGALQSEVAGMLASATDRMGQFGTPPPELLPRPVEGDANSPYPSFRAFDAITGQLIEIGSTGNRRPVEGEPAAGSRPTEPPPAANPPAGGGPVQASAITGVWKYSETRTGGRSIPGWDQTSGTMTLMADGRLTSQVSKPNIDPSQGTWSVQNGVLSMKIGTAPCLYEGRFDGQKWKGTYRCGKSAVNGVFELQR